MLKVGLTGNIGSGKSVISGIFSTLGVPVYHADAGSKQFLDVPEIMAELIRIFGSGVVNPSGSVDRAALAAIVFSDDAALTSLNALMHPLVIKDFLEWCSQRQQQVYVIQEAAILFESGYAKEFDRIIHVSCPEELAIERVMKRDRSDRESVVRRMRFQMKDAEKARLADFVILNDGSSMVIPQVLEIHKKLVGG